MASGFNPCVLIPTHNHFLALPRILDQLAARGLPVLIIDDGSHDKAAYHIAEAVRSASNVDLHRLEINQGKGAAVLAGFGLAQERGYTHALQLDADGQHDIEAVDSFVATGRAHPDAVIAGHPVFDETIPLGRKVGRWITDFWVIIHTHSFEITDSMCGFRLYPLGAALAVARSANIGRRMDFDTDMIVRLFWQETAIIMQPIRVTYPHGNTSNFRMF